MTAPADPSSRRAGRAETTTWLLLAALATAFVVAFGARATVILSHAAADDELFVRLGRYLAAGQWLGPYTEVTLVKGPGFPAFLALAHLFSLPMPLALALFHLACSAFASVVTWRLLGSRAAAIALFVLLLLLPPLYAGESLRASREVFYASLTLAGVSATAALAFRVVLPPVRGALLAGFLLAWWWLTREEGIWLLPSLALLLLVPLLMPDQAPASWRARLRPGRRTALLLAAPATAAALVVGFGLVNLAAYGRFVVNEITDHTFQGALDALQEAAAPYHRDLVPVPAAARAAIYRASPAFAELNGPVLESPGAGWAAPGCAVDRRMCGDIGGGWFFWAMRNAAAQHGHHRSAAEAARYYAQVEREVRQACAAGRLTCRAWPLPLIPPTRPEQMGDIATSLGRSLDFATFGPTIVTAVQPSDVSGPDAAEMVAFLGTPRLARPRAQRRFEGWFRGAGGDPADTWFEVAPGAGVSVTGFERKDSPDLVAYFRNPALARQRFSLSLDCPQPACPVEIRTAGRAAPLDMAALGPGGRPVAGAQLQVDTVHQDGEEPSLRNRLSWAWTRGAAALAPAYRLLAVAGALAYAAMLVMAARRRRLRPPLILCTALAGAVAARTLLLALIDALSFPAANYAYMMPAAPLLVLFAVVALADTAQALRTRVPVARSAA